MDVKNVELTNAELRLVLGLLQGEFCRVQKESMKGTIEAGIAQMRNDRIKEIQRNLYAALVHNNCKEGT